MIKTYALIFLSLLIAGWAKVAPTSQESTAARLAAAPYVPFKEEGFQSSFLNVATISPISGSRFFAGNFKDILIIDFDTKAIRKVPINGNAEIQPAGLYYARGPRLLFSADYLLNKVSVFRFDGAELHFLFNVPGLISPEGVAYDDKAGILSVAEFDGHGTSAWKIDANERIASKLWWEKVGYAHGIASMNGRVYSTSLLDRKIHVFDQATGKKIESFGAMGWEEKELQFLWPTYLATDGNGNLVVADAENGWVRIVNPNTKKVLASVGGAGPGRGRFSQPYTAVVADGKMAIASTKEERFVWLDYPSLNARMSLARKIDNWKGFPQNAAAFQADHGDYMWSKGPAVSLAGAEYKIWNSSLSSSQPKGGSISFGNAWGPVSYVIQKQLQFTKSGNYDVFFSPYTVYGPTLMKRVGSAVYALDFPSYFDRESSIHNCWAFEGNIRCANPEGYAIDAMKAVADKYVAGVEAKRCSNGVVPYPALKREIDNLRNEVSRHSKSEASSHKIADIFASDAGKKFFSEYENVRSCASSDNELKAIARQIVESDAKRLSIYELSLISVAVRIGSHYH